MGRPAAPASLEAIGVAVWAELQRSVADKAHPWRTPVLATVDGEEADARTVVLREADAGRRRLVVFSDARAAKLRQLQARPLGTLVMWSAALGWQLRCRVRLGVEPAGPAVDARWARLRRSAAAADYLSRLAPGTALEDGPAPPAPTVDPAAELTAAHFAVIEAEVLAIDWLELHPGGHRRAVFEQGAAWWLQP